jgi:predicted  nucleic acid-binding Zn-ribbon protein
MSEQAENDPNDGLRERLQKQGEDALGQVAQQLLESPLVHRALAGAFDAREKAAQAQEAAMGALNLPSAADLERLTRRVRSLSQRLEGIEDGVDRLDERLAALNTGPPTQIEERLGGIEDALQKLSNEVEALRKKLGATPPRRAAAKKTPATAAKKASA